MLHLKTPKRSLEVRSLLFDLDRTLTDERLRAVPSALRAIDRARDAGTRTILVTGRSRREMLARRTLLERFDAFVFESGGLLGTDPRALDRLGPPAPALAELAAWFQGTGVDYQRGDTCLSISTSDARALEAFPGGRAGFASHRNRDRIDVTAPGVEKGTAARRLLSSRDGGAAVAFADGENDRSLFEVADYRVAVANAVPELKALADETTNDYGGRGVARFLNERLLSAVTAT
jgi:phosphoglycolate phosphatase